MRRIQGDVVRARKVDACQPAIVEALRGVGAEVVVLNGAIDLLVWYQGQWTVMDCKSDNRRTQAQAHLVLRGCRIAFPKTSGEALRAIGVEVRG